MLVELLLSIAMALILYQRWSKRDIYKLGKQLNSGLWTIPFLGHSYLFIGRGHTLMKGFQIVGRDAIRNENGLTSAWHGNYLYTMAIWRQRRKWINPSFSTKHLKYFMTIFARESATLVQNMGKMAGSGVLSAFKFYTAYTMDVTFESTMGYQIGAQKETKHPLVEIFDDGISKASDRLCKPWLHSDLVYQNLPLYSNTMKRNKYVVDFMTEIIENKQKGMKENNLNSSDDSSKTMLESLLGLSGQDEGITNDEIREELLVMLVAANETSASGSSFTSLMLARHPEVQDKVYEELQEVFGDSDRPPTFDDLPRLKYLDAVIRESMRLYPPVPIIIRKVEKDVLLPCGIKLVPGTGVLVNIWALHRNPRYWGDDAELFRPERFIDTPLTHPAAFMPFSYGPRNCVGHQYAMISMKTALSSVLRRYKILPATAPNKNSEYPPIRLKHDIIMKDEEDFPIRLEPRC